MTGKVSGCLATAQPDPSYERTPTNHQGDRATGKDWQPAEKNRRREGKVIIHRRRLADSRYHAGGSARYVLSPAEPISVAASAETDGECNPLADGSWDRTTRPRPCRSRLLKSALCRVSIKHCARCYHPHRHAYPSERSSGKTHSTVTVLGRRFSTRNLNGKLTRI